MQTGAGAIERALDDADGVYVALDCDAVEPAELEVFMPEPAGLRLDEVEPLLRDVAARPRSSASASPGSSRSGERAEARAARDRPGLCQRL